MKETIIITYDYSERAYIASVPSCCGIVARGDSYEEAVEKVQIALEDYILHKKLKNYCESDAKSHQEEPDIKEHQECEHETTLLSGFRCSKCNKHLLKEKPKTLLAPAFFEVRILSQKEMKPHEFGFSLTEGALKYPFKKWITDDRTIFSSKEDAVNYGKTKFHEYQRCVWPARQPNAGGYHEIEADDENV